MRLLFVWLFVAEFAFAAEVKRQNVVMPGDGGFGFFQKAGYCRIRTRPVCSFRLFTTKMRDQIVEIRIRSNFMRARTDDDGVFDVKFKCSQDLLAETVTVLTANYQTAFKLKDTPKVISIPEHRCNVQLNF
jgi:hypothetical protein